jgi:membrane protein YdbS with pleckstrin-like domain
MPVIACPDCSRDVSTLASSCPHCGRPMSMGPDVLPLASPIHEPRPIPAEETLWRGTPSAIVLAGNAIWIAIIAIAAAIFAKLLNASDPSQGRFVWMIAAILIAFFVLRALFSYIRIVSTIYTVTNQRVMIERGLLSKSLSEIDLRYIDDSNFTQGAIERLLGIGQVTLISSDKSSPVYTLQNIRDPRGVRELIRSNAYTVSQRQLFTRAT